MDSIPRVLVIEDDEAVLYYVRVVLERHGFEVLSAPDGISGFMKVAEERPDLIVADYYMPGLNGLHFVEKVRNTPETATIPVVVVSVDGSTLLRRQCLEAGAYAFLEEPFAPEQLVSIVLTALS